MSHDDDQVVTNNVELPKGVFPHPYVSLVSNQFDYLLWLTRHATCPQGLQPQFTFLLRSQALHRTLFQQRSISTIESTGSDSRRGISSSWQRWFHSVQAGIFHSHRSRNQPIIIPDLHHVRQRCHELSDTQWMGYWTQWRFDQQSEEGGTHSSNISGTVTLCELCIGWQPPRSSVFMERWWVYWWGWDMGKALYGACWVRQFWCFSFFLISFS